MFSKNNPLSRKEDIVVQELDGEVLIYDLRANKAFCLNETSALIWQACDGDKDVPQLSEFVAKRLNSKANEDLVWLALDQLKKEKLIDNMPVSDGRFAGMSRREVIKKVAVGSMIAIPIVSGLVAPPAYAQGSTCGTTCQCSGGSNTRGNACHTNGGGTPCPSTPSNCLTCEAINSTPNSAGRCVVGPLT